MPGAPNKPPEIPRPPAAATDPRARCLRRLVPSRVALHLPIWRDLPRRELLEPLQRADRAFDAGDYRLCEQELDHLAVRFHEPRWPTLPEPFRSLRVPIPLPEPPSWNPDHALPSEERQRRELRREAERSLALARASVEWAKQRGLLGPEADGPLAEAGSQLPKGDEPIPAAFYDALESVWTLVRERVPMPGAGGPAPPAPVSEAAADS